MRSFVGKQELRPLARVVAMSSPVGESLSFGSVSFQSGCSLLKVLSQPYLSLVGGN